MRRLVSIQMTRGRGDARHGGQAPTRSYSARGVMLLEVLLSLGLLVFGFAVIGLRVNMAMSTALKSRFWTTGMLLSETIMSKVQGGDIEFKQGEDELKGHFKIYYPGYSWRIKIRPCEIDNLFLMTLEIGYNDANRELQIQSPEREIDFDDDGTKTIRTAYRLVPKPADINFTRDMGIAPEDLQMDEAAAAGGQGGGAGGEAGGGGGGGGMDAMSALLAMIRDFLTKHPELLNADGGIDVNAIRNLQGEDFDEAMSLIKLLNGDPSGLEELKDMLGELANSDASDAKEGGEGQADGGEAGGGQAGGGGQGAQGGKPETQGGRPPIDSNQASGNGQRNTGGRRPNRQEPPANDNQGGGRRNVGGKRNQPGNNPGNSPRRNPGSGGRRGDNSQANDNLQEDKWR